MQQGDEGATRWCADLHVPSLSLCADLALCACFLGECVWRLYPPASRTRACHVIHVDRASTRHRKYFAEYLLAHVASSCDGQEEEGPPLPALHLVLCRIAKEPRHAVYSSVSSLFFWKWVCSFVSFVLWTTAAQKASSFFSFLPFLSLFSITILPSPLLTYTPTHKLRHTRPSLSQPWALR